ncbi:uncharacterized protein KLLA0_E00881g [Kluyveromyces lactis]|uniref:KLLA0E00881p n=1 Tax=Kluyveromyces lactis (strain ATCC 8585 / CBS 2359 / DSM 70799 / NBRC 1267 / NRRL Y-1140 / WM37) TaxID=284590 RepID=Q6CQ01_KLULA|nr:uncharacterized protein KLLA0_E00881g [Kluyveromyces lactis]CAG99075.1 KLLA0E00881p [Kluyveromyces lactis]|eukprot:XP_453988.1 uncharacterized protein KLLA0_E00881g [Kluyveromyces lactis]
MDSLDNIIPFTAHAFLRPESKQCLFNSISEWSLLQGKQCLFRVPPGFEIVRTEENSSDSISVSCILRTNNLEDITKWDPLAFSELALHLESDNSEWYSLFQCLLHDWNKKHYNANIVLLGRNDVKESTVSNDERLILFGLKSKLAIMEIELKCAIAVKQHKYVDVIDFKAVSMMPLLAGQNGGNWKHLSECFHTEVIDSQLGILGHDYPSKLFLQSEQKCDALLAKQCLEKKLNDILDGSLHATAIPNVSPLKIAYLKTVFPSETIMKLMQKYPSYINYTTGSVQLQSNSAALLDIVRKRFVRNILAVISEVRFWFTESNDATELINRTSTFKRIASKNNVIFSTDKFKNFFNFVGCHASIQQTYLDILAEDFQCVQNVRFTLELDTIYKDFISGKKNGKLMKIMDRKKCAISLENDSSGHMLVILQGEDWQQIQDSFSLLLQELPCEKSFFIPEAYHRPVIGTGGSVIQTIMRKYNVFIQFSNSFQLPQGDWTFTRYDNVIIRCPSKNTINIEAAKEQLLSLSEQYSQVQKTVYVKMSPSQYLYLIHMNSDLSFISEIEKAHSCYISFPQSLPVEGYHINVKGNDTGPERAANDIISRFGREMEIHIKNPASENEFSKGLLLPLSYSNVQFTQNRNFIRLTFSPLMKPSQLEEIIFLIDSFLKLSNNKIISKREVAHYTSVTPLYRVGKQLNTTIENSPQTSILKSFSQVRI